MLEFRDELKIYVPLDQAYLVGRYIAGGQKKLPTLSRVRGTQWQKARAAAEEAVEEEPAEEEAVEEEPAEEEATEAPAAAAVDLPESGPERIVAVLALCREQDGG